jgi:hypothetical protein
MTRLQRLPRLIHALFKLSKHLQSRPICALTNSPNSIIARLSGRTRLLQALARQIWLNLLQLHPYHERLNPRLRRPHESAIYDSDGLTERTRNP